MALPRLFVLWLVLGIVLGVSGIHFGLFGTGPRKTEAFLKQKVEARLSENKIDWAEVKMKGQAVYLEGIAPNQKAVKEAQQIALTTLGSGGVLAGGITKVYSDRVQIAEKPVQLSDDKLDQAEAEEVESEEDVETEEYEPVFELKLDTDHVTIEGETSDRYTEEAIREWSKAHFSGHTLSYEIETVNQLIDPVWYATLKQAIKALSYLKTGELRARGSVFMIEGIAADNESLNLALNSLGENETPYSIIAQITAEKTEDKKAVEQNIGQIQDKCQKSIDELKKNKKIYFLFNRAEISEKNNQLLKEIVEAMDECGDLRLRVEGHTDNTGPDIVNDALSLSRAQAVVAKLVEFGTNKEKLLAIGYGAKQPIADNSSREGRAKNRRIEFIIEK